MPNSFTCIRPRFEDFLQKVSTSVVDSKKDFSWDFIPRLKITFPFPLSQLHLLGFTKYYDSTETTLPLFRHEVSIIDLFYNFILDWDHNTN